MRPIFDFIRKYRGQIIITVVLAVITILMPFEMRYAVSFSGGELNLTSEAAGTAELTDDDDPVFLIEEETGFSGTAAELDVTLRKSAYTLQISAISEGPGNYIEIYDSQALNEDNTQGVLIASAALDTENTVTEISFETDDSLEDISIHVVYGGTGYLNIGSLYLVSDEHVYNNTFIWAGLIILASALVLVWRVFKGDPDGTGRRAAIVLTAAVVLTCLPLSYDFILGGNDLYYHFNRILGIQEALLHGQFPVKIHSTLLHGYGYGSSIFYPEAILYLPAALGCLGMSLIGCYKFLLVMINAATAGISYISFGRITGSRNTGLAAAVFYTLSIYRLTDLYSRAAVGEALAMVFLPLLAWGMYELILGDHRKWYIAVAAFTGIMQSHVLSVAICLLFCVIFTVVYIKKLFEKDRLVSILKGAALCILINLGTALSILSQMQYDYKVFTMEVTLSDLTAALPKLFDLLLFNTTSHVYAGLTNSGEMPLSLGFVTLVGITAFLYAWFKHKDHDQMMKKCMCVLILAAAAVWMSSNIFPWDRVQNIPLIGGIVDIIQFPWRFLSIAVLLLSIVGAVGFDRCTKDRTAGKLVCAASILLAFICATVYINRYCEEGEVTYTVENQYTSAQGQVDSMYFIDQEKTNGNRVWNRDNTFVTSSEDIELSGCYRGEDLHAGFSFTKSSDGNDGWVEVSYLWYPGYRAYLDDGTELSTSVGENGALRVEIPDDIGEGTVSIVYMEDSWVSAGRVISVIALFGTAVLIVIERRGKVPVTSEGG